MSNRMSLAGPPLRAPPPPVGPPGQRRRTTQLQPTSSGGPPMPSSSQTSAGGGGGNPGSSQGNRGGAAYGTTPRASTNVMRRSSVYQGGRQSIMTPSHGASSRLAPLPGTSAFDDPRPLKSLAFKEQAGATIIAFFQRHPRAPQVTEKTMLSPTQVEFQQMFKFLVVVVLDDDYAFGKGGKKFDEECIQLLKDLEYPAMSGLSRTAIGAPGSPTNWPAMLAMLLWLVELADTRENWMSGEVYPDYDLLPPEQVPLDAPTLYELFLWDYLSNAYAKWYEGSEECPEEDRQLEDNFQRKFQSFDEEMEANEQLIEQCQREWAELTSKPDPLLLLNEEFGKFESDKKKFISLIDHQTQKRSKLLQQTQNLTDYIMQTRAAANTLQAELASVQAAVQVQGLSVEEVTRLNTDHETLTHSYEETRQKVAQAREDLWSREMLVSRRSDQLETLVGEYNAAVYRLGLHPSPPAEVGDVSFLLLYEAAGATEREMLSGDVRGTLSPALSRLLSGRRLEITDIEGTIIKADHDLDELTQAVEALKEEIEIRTARVKSTSDQAESQRNIATVESAELSAQQQHLEREIASSRAMSKQALLASESKMETLKMEHDKMVHNVSKLREDTIAAIIYQTEFIIKFKEAAGETLEGLKRFAELN